MNHSSSDNTSQIPQTKDAWSTSSLAQQAFLRWKKTIPLYIVSTLFLGAIGVGCLLVIILFIAGIRMISGVSFFILPILGIAIILGIIYLLVLMQLTGVTLLTGKQKEVLKAIHEVKPLVWKYVGISILFALFSGGLFIFKVLSLFAVALLWWFWDSFTIFVFLDQKQNGLNNLWISKEMISRKWKLILTKSLLPFGMIVVSILIYYFITIALHIKGLSIEIAFHILDFFISSYIICFTYEMYHLLEKIHTPKKSKVWIGLSITGWVINLALLVLFGWFISQKLSTFLKPHASQTSLVTNSSQNIFYATPNQETKLSDRIFTVEALQKHFPVLGIDSISPSQEMIAATVSIANTSNNIIAYNPYDFFVQNKFGQLFGPQFSFRLADMSMLGSGNLAPGATKAGTIIFIVERADEPFLFLYEPFAMNQPRKTAVGVKL